MSLLAAELTAIDLGDQRLNRRAGKLLEALGDKPTASIPAACGGWDETKARLSKSAVSLKQALPGLWMLGRCRDRCQGRNEGLASSWLL
jgi:hypothetical protein